MASLQTVTNRPVGSVPLIVLRAEAMRFADDYAAIVARAADDFASKVATPEARLAALKWKLHQATTAYIGASGPHPTLNALDLVVLATVSRMVVEDYGVGQMFGEAALPLLETHRKLETNAWLLVNAVLTPEQRQELADMIKAWREKNPHQRYLGGIRFGELAAALGQTMFKTSTKATSVFSLLYLNPLAGMDPTTAAIQEARYSAERAMYYAQRMPQLLSWQAELLASQLADEPESKQLLSDAARLSASAEIFAKTAEQLPALIKEQRQATIQQVFDNLVAEEKVAHDLLGEVRQTLSAGNETAVSVNAAVKSIDELVHFVMPTNSTAADSGTNSRPFDVLDYGTAATQFAVAARELNTLLTTVNATTPQLARLSEQATERADHVLYRAFGLGLLLILVLSACLVLAGMILVRLAYRFLVNELSHDGIYIRKPESLRPPSSSTQ